MQLNELVSSARVTRRSLHSSMGQMRFNTCSGEGAILSRGAAETSKEKVMQKWHGW